MDILEQIKAECARHEYGIDCEGCRLVDENDECVFMGLAIEKWNTEEIRKRLNDGIHGESEREM